MTVHRPYRRVSMEEQIENFSLPAQTESIEDYAAKHRLTLSGWYGDEGVSAKNMEGRPDLQRLFRDANKGDTILVFKLDRLTRSTKDLEYLLELSEQGRLYFQSVTENIETATASGRMFVRQLIQFAQFERELIGERTKVGKRKRATSGVWSGGIAPFGYRFVPSGEVRKRRQLMKLARDEERAHIVPMMFERYLAGHGARTVARWLNEELGVRTPRGRPFSTNAVKAILMNVTYIGHVPIDKKRGSNEHVPGTHPALISLDLFEAVQAKFEQRKTYAPRHATGPYPLAGIARCGICGGAICAGRTGKSGWRIYRCSNHTRGRGCGDPPLQSVSAKMVEDALVAEIDNIVHRSQSFDAFFNTCLAETTKQTGVSQAEVDRLRTDLQDVEMRYKRWGDRYEAGECEWDEYRERATPLKERRTTLQERLAELEAKVNAQPNKEAMRAVFASFATLWAKGTHEERKQFLQDFVEEVPVEIIVHRDRSVEFRNRPAPSSPPR